jgi:very-short-patch-repair endonuclease
MQLPLPPGEGRGEGMDSMDAVRIAKKLRRNETDAEKILWRYLRNRQCGGYKFRRQVPIGSYVVDFLCIDARLVVELDGGQHAEAVAQDAERTKFLESLGYMVIRFWNDEVMGNVAGVFDSLTLTLSRRERELRAKA